MKKILAIMFALIFALSFATSAFAVTNTCTYCGEEISVEKDFNKHLEQLCPVLYPEKDPDAGKQYCPYDGCTGEFLDPAQYEIHLEKCPMKPSEDDASIADKIADFFENLKFEDILNTVNDLFSKINFTDIVVKIIDLLEEGVNALLGAI